MLKIKWFSGNDDLKDSHSVRKKVFIDEQKIDENAEFDGSDKYADIVVLYDSDIPVATGRLILKENKMTIGRIAVLKSERHKNYGTLVVKNLVNKAFELGYKTQYLHSQSQAVGFYEKVGFVKYGDEFLEENIPHYKMKHTGSLNI